MNNAYLIHLELTKADFNVPKHYEKSIFILGTFLTLGTVLVVLAIS